MRLLPVAALALVVAAQASADRPPATLLHAQDELAASRDLAAAATNEQERLVWQKRADLAQKELENIQQRGQLEERERMLTRQLSSLGARQRLVEQLRVVETDTTEAEKRAAELERDLRRLQSQRADLVESLNAAPETEQSIEQRAESGQRIQNLDDLIRSKAFERDALDYRIRLAEQAVRIDRALRERELNPKPTIRKLLDMRRQAADARKAAADEQSMREMVAQQRAAAAEYLALTQERFAHVDEEIQTLDGLYGTGKRSLLDFSKTDVTLAQRQRQIARMLADSRNQRRFLQERLGFLKSQVAALDMAIQALDDTQRLLSAEAGFLDQERQDVARRFRARVTLPLAVLALLLLLNEALRRIILPVLVKSDNLFVTRRAVSYALGLIAVVFLALFFFDDLKSVATILGLAGAAVVIALQDLCSAFAGWFVILTSRKIQVGDRIEVDGARGDVVDIQLLRTTLLEVGNWMDTDEATGRVIVIPNSFIFKSQFFNFSHTHPYIWGKIRIALTFESPAQAAREMLLRVLTEETRGEFDEARRAAAAMKERYGMTDGVYEPRLTEHIGESGVVFNLYYVCHYRKDDETRAKLARRLLRELEQHPELRPAYPTQRELETPSPISYSRSQHA